MSQSNIDSWQQVLALEPTDKENIRVGRWVAIYNINVDNYDFYRVSRIEDAGFFVEGVNNKIPMKNYDFYVTRIKNIPRRAPND